MVHKIEKDNSVLEAISCQRSKVTNGILKFATLFAISQRSEPHASQYNPEKVEENNVREKEKKTKKETVRHGTRSPVHPVL